MIVLACGSRGWTDLATIHRRIGELPPDSIVIHGGARGADELAGLAAHAHGFNDAVVRPLWDLHGKSAGRKRNAAMLDLRPDRVIAFSLGTPGTASTIRMARERGIPVEVVGSADQGLAA